MSSVCSDQNLHKLLSPKKSLDIPPRKLLTRRAAVSAATHDGDMFSDDTNFQKFLPYNNASDGDSDSDDPYSSDHFRMYEFKVRRCTRSRSHDWTDCPFAHPGEKARRRDPRRYHYSGTVCPEYRRGGVCGRGDSCEFAHGVFECWLHPARYRTEACKDGKHCKRKICFFAHTPKQLRILPVTMNSSNDCSPCKKNNLLSNNCCMFCHHCGGGGGANSTNSPTSTLFGMSRFSPPLSPSSSATSPPVSPVKTVSPISRRYGVCRGGGASYEDVVSELMSSLEGLSFSDGLGISSPVARTTSLPPWVDDGLGVSSPVARTASLPPWVDVSNLGCEDHQQFAFSPSMSMMMPTSYSSFFSNNDKSVANNAGGADVNNGSNCPAPDLGWVNDLLM